VITYSVVAIHDDDILEDMIRASEKDPIILRACDDSDLKLPSNDGKQDGTSAVLLALVSLLVRALTKCGSVITLERLVNREIDVVKLVVPMHGLRRLDPIVGAVQATGDVTRLGVWKRLNEVLSKGDSRARTAMAAVFPEVETRPFVFYVKQRMV